MAGKGDAYRPLGISEEQFGKNYDRIDWSAHRGLVDADADEPSDAMMEKIKAVVDQSHFTADEAL